MAPATLAAGVCVATLLGCESTSRLDTGIAERGLVWVLPGIEGGPWSVSMAMQAFRDAGVQAELRPLDWKRPFGTLKNLTDYSGNRRRAREVARQIVDYRAEHHTAPVDLVGYSGGGGLAVMVAEELPDDVHVRNVVLAQPALSPDYDLSAALRRIDGTLVNFHSDNDWLILGLGTRVFGTIDRKYGESAGKTGFLLERAVPDAELRPHFQQQAWTTEMIWSGHLGNHLSILWYAWNKRYVAPYLLPGGGAAPQRS